jgi:hypothetical protein
MKIQVECHSPYKSNERPSKFWIDEKVFLSRRLRGAVYSRVLFDERESRWSNRTAVNRGRFPLELGHTAVAGARQQDLQAMPKDDTDPLTPQESADVLAYILQAGRFPSGRAELVLNEAALKG